LCDRFCSCDFDLVPTALIYDLNLDILKNFLGPGVQKLEHEQDRQTHTHTETDRRGQTHYTSTFTSDKYRPYVISEFATIDCFINVESFNYSLNTGFNKMLIIH